MNPELLGRVLHHAKFWKSLKDLHFYMSGEPLMHPEIAKMCIVANELGYKPAFSSNGALLDDKMAEKMLAAGVTYIGFSIDSLDPGLYRKLQGGDLWEIERKIMRWQELCLRKTGSFSGSIMCVLGEENRNEAEDFFRIWTARGFTVLFNYELDVHTREMLGATHKLTRIGPCANPRFLFLDSGANVLLCPAQLNGSNINAPGFLSRHPEEIWLDPERSRFLQRLLEGERLDFCFQCSGSALMANGTWTCRKEQPIYESECGWYGAPPDNWRTLKGWQG